jgi:hypothetical protein
MLPAVAVARRPPVRVSADGVYSGVAADGATVRLTVAANGTRVQSYRFTHVIGRETAGRGCTFEGDGAAGVWAGVAITHGSFAYRLGDALRFRGRLRNASVIHGTFSFYVPGVGQTPACTTGTVRFTASARTLRHR